VLLWRRDLGVDLLTFKVEWLSPADNSGGAQFVQFDFEKVVRGTVASVYFIALDPEEQVLVHGLSAKVCHKPGQFGAAIRWNFNDIIISII